MAHCTWQEVQRHNPIANVRFWPIPDTMTIDESKQTPTLSRRTKLLIFAVVWIPAMLLAVTVAYFANISFWWALALVAAAWVVNGLIAG